MGFGWTETLLIMGIVLLVFGPNKLPDFARSLGKSMNILKEEFKGAKSSVDGVTNSPGSLEEEASGMKQEVQEVGESHETEE